MGAVVPVPAGRLPAENAIIVTISVRASKTATAMAMPRLSFSCFFWFVFMFIFLFLSAFRLNVYVVAFRLNCLYFRRFFWFYTAKGKFGKENFGGKKIRPPFREALFEAIIYNYFWGFLRRYLSTFSTISVGTLRSMGKNTALSSFLEKPRMKFAVLARLFAVTVEITSPSGVKSI